MKSNTLLLLICLAASHAGFAQESNTVKSTGKTKVATAVDVAVDAIKFDSNNKDEEIIVEGKDVILSGDDNRLTFKGTIGKILITGKNNDITIESVNQIMIPGNGNFVSWEKSSNANGKPIIQDKGGYNNVERRSGDAQDRSDN